ncbi:MAG: hypothetical protein ACI83W_000791 [Marinoscillum sp.]|jgi:hypothetical protein
MIRSITKPIILILSLFASQLLIAQSVKIGETSYNTITEAIVAATDGAVIEIRGIHTGSVVIQKNLTIKGADPKVDIIQAAASLAESQSRVLSVIDTTGSLTVSVENLGIRYGNAAENGGGVNVDKVAGLLTLKNLIIEQNNSARNGGGIMVAGSIMKIIGCAIINNTATQDGGGILLAPNNAVSKDSDIDITGTLIDGNVARNGGGLYINGNKNFGNNHKIDVYLENTTVSNNSATSVSDGGGGGGIWSRSAFWTGDNTTGNITLKLVHTTMYNNTHASLLKNGIQFASDPAGALTNFSIYNSIVVSQDSLAEKALNFANTNTTEAINNILGGLNGLPSFMADSTMNANRNNSNGRTASFAGISTTLSDEGGAVNVFAIKEEANAFNYCTVATGITLPTTDARGASRDMKPDAGAFELLVAPTVVLEIEDQIFQTGFASSTIDLSAIFADGNGDALSYSASLADDGIVSISFDGDNMVITEVGDGTTTVTITADDGTGLSVSDDFTVLISENAVPTIDSPLEDLSYESGFISATIDLTGRFTDGDEDPITLSVSVLDESVITVALSEEVLTITEVADGTTTVTVTANDGKGGVARETFEVEVSSIVLGQEKEFGVSIYPNPASSWLKVKGLEASQLDRVQVLDLSGRRHSARISGSDGDILIDISQLEAGQYFLVIGQSNQKQLVKRFIKSNF